MIVSTQPTLQNRSDSPAVARRDEWNWQRTLVLVSAAALAVIAPAFFLGNASGHDIQFHLASWIDVQGQWKEGILFPRWAEWANWGYGEPRFIFYPPASWILGAALSSVVPWNAVTNTFIFICLVGAGMSAWWLARGWTPGAPATVAAILYAVNPYQVANVYYRSDFAELLAFVFFPLLVWGALRSLREGWTSATIVAVPFAAIWVSNAPAAVLATYSLCLILAAGCVASKAWKKAIPGAAGMGLGFGLAAFYILPAAWEQKWVQIQQAISTDLQPFHNFLFIKDAEPEFLFFNLKISFVALEVIFLTAIAAVFFARRRKEFPELWWPMLALAAGASLLMFSPAAFLWTWLPKLQYVQFPWRWAGPLGLVFALFAAGTYPGGKTGRRIWLGFLGLAIIGTGLVIGSDTWWDTEDANFVLDSVHAAKGYEGTDEYAPLGCDRYELPESGPRISQVQATTGKLVPVEDDAVQIKKWTAERIQFDVVARQPEILVLRRLNYPAWDGFVDRTRVPLTSRAETGEIELAVAEGRHAVEIHFRRTWDRAAGGAISVLSLGMLIGLEWSRRRKKSAMA
jgi:hypothetical protein